MTVEVGDEGAMEDESMRDLADMLEVAPVDLFDGGGGGGEEDGVEADEGEGAEGGADEENQERTSGDGGGGGGGNGNAKPAQMTLVVLHDGHRFSIYRLVDGSEADAAAGADGEPDDAPDDDDEPEPPAQATRASDNRYAERALHSDILYSTVRTRLTLTSLQYCTKLVHPHTVLYELPRGLPLCGHSRVLCGGSEAEVVS